MPSVRQTILETFSLRGPLGIEEIAQATNLSKMAARYHMHLLERDGLVKPFKAALGGSVGRPRLVYALAERAQESLPKRYDALASRLLGEISQALGPKKARGLMHRAGRRAALAAPPLPRGAGIESRLNRLVRFLAPDGYRVSWENASEGAHLVVHDCPYYRVARTQPLVCEMDRAFFSALLGAPLVMETCIAACETQCRFVIQSKSEQ